LLVEMPERPITEYPIGIYRDEVVVWQLGEFREERAVMALQRIATFDPKTSEEGPFGQTRQRLVAPAQEALRKIRG
jgi:hypothetical protein